LLPLSSTRRRRPRTVTGTPFALACVPRTFATRRPPADAPPLALVVPAPAARQPGRVSRPGLFGDRRGRLRRAAPRGIPRRREVARVAVGECDAAVGRVAQIPARARRMPSRPELPIVERRTRTRTGGRRRARCATRPAPL
jgi:hypothetical protein